MDLSRFQRVAGLLDDYNRLKEAAQKVIEKRLGFLIIGVEDIEYDENTNTIIAYYCYFDDDYKWYDRENYDKHTLNDCEDIAMDELDEFFNPCQ